MTVLTEARTALPTGAWTLDPVHSTIGFELPYLAGTFRGQFRDVDARLTETALEGSANVASVDVKDENLAAHLQAPDFFDAERNPELRFSAEDVTIDGGAVKARGQITIKGVTKDVEVEGTSTGPIVDGYGNGRIGLQLSAAVDRTGFGLEWNTPLPTGEPALSNDVRIVSDLQFVKGS